MASGCRDRNSSAWSRADEGPPSSSRFDNPILSITKDPAKEEYVAAVMEKLEYERPRQDGSGVDKMYSLWITREWVSPSRIGVADHVQRGDQLPELAGEEATVSGLVARNRQSDRRATIGCTCVARAAGTIAAAKTAGASTSAQTM